MEQEPRKASDIILELVGKIDQLLSTVKTQDLNIKILSNKINQLLSQSSVTPPKQQFSVESVNTVTAQTISQVSNQIEQDPDRFTIINAEENLPIESSPKGFRRTSRPETVSGNNNSLQQGSKKFPVQIPEIVVPSKVTANKSSDESVVFTDRETLKPDAKPSSGNAVPVVQRVVDKNGKAVFLADVEIIDLNDPARNVLVKTRTNATGKWMASLNVGSYKIVLRKREALTKEKIELIQSIVVDGSVSPYQLETLIINK